MERRSTSNRPSRRTLNLFRAGIAFRFSASAKFNSTVTLSSALVLTGTPNAPGTQVSGTMIGSADTFTYGLNVTSAVPAPGTWLLVCAPLAFMAMRLCRWLVPRSEWVE